MSFLVFPRRFPTSLSSRARSEWTEIQPKIMNNHNLRPLSPHLPIYKPQLTSTFPISHRISGAFLATLVFFFYLLYLKIGLICFTYENFYQFFFYSSKLILISVEITALALSYHLYNGVRHLLTDFSFLELEEKDWNDCSKFHLYLWKKKLDFLMKCLLLRW